MYGSAFFARTVLALAVIFSIATTVGFAITPPAGPWWWTSAFVDGQFGLITIWATLGPAPWYLRWPCWFGALELTRASHLRWLTLPHVLLTFVLLLLLREFRMWVARRGGRSGLAVSQWQVTLRTMFLWVAATALALWVWKHRMELSPWRWVTDFHYLAECASLTALDLIAIRVTLHHSSIRWRLLWLVLAVMLARMAVWHFSGVRGWWYGLPRMCTYDVFYLAPIVGALAAYRWAMASGNGGSPECDSHRPH